MMFTRSYYIALAVIGLCSCFILFANAEDECKLDRCPGPLYYYRELGCTAIFGNASSCCPTRYNCDHLKNLPEEKCFANGRVYERGEMVPLQPTDKTCTNCSCPESGDVELSCQPSTCTIPEEKALSESPSSRQCVSAIIFLLSKVLDDCAPLFTDLASPADSCNSKFRCYDAERDFIMEDEAEDRGSTTTKTFESGDSDATCKFGNLTMLVGQSLKPINFTTLYVRECICEVPPVLTCQDKPL